MKLARALGMTLMGLSGLLLVSCTTPDAHHVQRRSFDLAAPGEALAIVTLSDMQKGDVVDMYSLGIAQVGQYSDQYIDFKDLAKLDGQKLRYDVPVSQPLMKHHFSGL